MVGCLLFSACLAGISNVPGTAMAQGQKKRMNRAFVLYRGMKNNAGTLRTTHHGRVSPKRRRPGCFSPRQKSKSCGWQEGSKPSRWISAALTRDSSPRQESTVSAFTSSCTPPGTGGISGSPRRAGNFCTDSATPTQRTPAISPIRKSSGAGMKPPSSCHLLPGGNGRLCRHARAAVTAAGLPLSAAARRNTAVTGAKVWAGCRMAGIVRLGQTRLYVALHGRAGTAFPERNVPVS